MLRPSVTSLSPGLRQRLSLRSRPFASGPQRMNINQPLSRASRMAETMMQQSQKRGSSYFYPFPNIPRPKRNVFYYSTWSRNRVVSNRRNGGLLNLRLSKRSLSNANQRLKNKTKNIHKRFFSTEARKKRQQKRKFIRWWTITSLTVIIGGVAAKINYEKGLPQEDDEYRIKPQSWQLYIYSTLPLKTMSRLWGQVNSINLPVWLRTPSLKLYSAVFGVNLDEIEVEDLTTYRNLSEFFFRRLKPNARDISNAELVSPSDGKILKFGVIENGEIEQVKGMTYSIDSLLGLNSEKLAAPSHSLEFNEEPGQTDEAATIRRDEEFAKINGISYSLDDIVGGENTFTHHLNDFKYMDQGDKTAKGHMSSVSKEVSVARSMSPSMSDLVRSKKNLYFAVIYLAPGDYHRFHSPTSWVATLRRHFIGELFSVAPFFQKTLRGLFVLNERVALLGYWKYGFFSMIPVGATNVGSIVINFDKDLKTNDVYENEIYGRSSSDETSQSMRSDSGSTSDLSTSESRGSRLEAPKKLKKNTVYEATYTRASRLLGGYPLTKGQEVGGFKLGSTVVLVFEAPDNFHFDLQAGQKVKMGQSLGHLEENPID